MIISLPYQDQYDFYRWISNAYPILLNEIQQTPFDNLSTEYQPAIQKYYNHRMKKFISDDIKFDMWSCFNYQGHDWKTYAKRIFKERKTHRINPLLKRDIKGNLDGGLYALKNYFKSIAIDTHQHIMLWIGYEYQPTGKKPHYHCGIKFENYTPTSSRIIKKWTEYNPANKVNSSAWIQKYNTQRDGILYQERCDNTEIYIACPKRSKRCKKNKCKGGRLF